MASGRTTEPGQRGSGAGGHGPVGEASWRRRPGKTTFRVPCASALRVVPSQIANDRISLSLSLSIQISFPPQVSWPGRSIGLRPFIIFGSLHLVFLVLFCYEVETPWRR